MVFIDLTGVSFSTVFKCITKLNSVVVYVNF